MLRFFPRYAATYRPQPTGHYNDDGVFVPDTVAEIPIQIIAPQPANGRELQRLPEGDRKYRHLKTWCDIDLQAGAIVTYPPGGTEYIVLPSMDYQTDGNFSKVLMRENQQ